MSPTTMMMLFLLLSVATSPTNAQRCPMELWLLDSLAACTPDQVPYATAQLYADNTCRLADSNPNLPGSYIASCNEAGNLVFTSSACLSNTCSSSTPGSNVCDRASSRTNPAALWALISYHVVQSPSLETQFYTCYSQSNGDGSLVTVYAIFGDCSDPSCGPAPPPTLAPTPSSTFPPTNSPGATSTLPPVTPPTNTPITPAATLAPVTHPTSAPIASASTVAPVTPPTLAPVTPPTLAPVTPPTNAPMTPAATLAPVAPPTLAPVTPPTNAPITPAATLAPVTPPTSAPITSASTLAPVTPPTLAPVIPPASAPITSAPTLAPVALPTTSPITPPIPTSTSDSTASPSLLSVTLLPTPQPTPISAPMSGSTASPSAEPSDVSQVNSPRASELVHLEMLLTATDGLLSGRAAITWESVTAQLIEERALQEMNWRVSVTINIIQQLVTSGLSSRRERFLQGNTDTAGSTIKPLLIKFDANVNFESVPKNVSAVDLIGEAFNSVSERDLYRDNLQAADSAFSFVTAVKILVEGEVPIEESSQLSNSSNNNSTEKVIAGVVIGVLILVAVVTLFTVLRRRQEKKKKEKEDDPLYSDTTSPNVSLQISFQHPELERKIRFATAADPEDKVESCWYDFENDAMSAMTSLPGLDGLALVEDPTISLDYDFSKQQGTDTTDDKESKTIGDASGKASAGTSTLLGLDYLDPTEDGDDDN